VDRSQIASDGGEIGEGDGRAVEKERGVGHGKGEDTERERRIHGERTGKSCPAQGPIR
jgi:hypothetical protein